MPLPPHRFAPLALFVAVAGALPSAAQAAAAPAPAASPHGSSALPAAARGPLSAALGSHGREYRVAGLRAHNRSQRLGARFSRSGVTVASGPAQARLRLAASGRGRALQPVGPAAPRASANRVDYAHGGIGEWWANGPLGLEQGFDVESRPAGPAGAPPTLALAVAGDLHPRLDGSGVALEGRGESLRYDGLTATDAHGHTLGSSLRVRSARVT